MPKKANRISLISRLQTHIASLSVGIAFFAIVAIALFTFRFAHIERKKNTDSLASAFARLVARPISLGDYILAEDLLSGESLPDYVLTIQVRDHTGYLIAAKNNHALDASCKPDITSVASTQLGTSNMNGNIRETPSITLTASSCDLFKRTLRLSMYGTIFCLVFFFLLLRTSQVAVSHSLRPLYAAVDLYSTKERIDSDLIDAAPAEIHPLLVKLDELYVRTSKMESDLRIGQLATQVAHDIRAPLAALEVALQTTVGLPDEMKGLAKNAIGRVQDIANNLLKITRESNESLSIQTEHSSPLKQNLATLVNELILEKRLQYRIFNEINIIQGPLTSVETLYAMVNRTEFLRTLSNLIDNGIDALKGRGTVTISLKTENDSVLVSIADDGHGIPNHLLSRLGNKGESHGKKNGNGLGLFHAKNSVESWGGSLVIQSVNGVGTTIALKIPTCRPVMHQTSNNAPLMAIAKPSPHGIKAV